VISAFAASREARGQFLYRWMLGNWVYFVFNGCLIGTNALGLALAAHRRGVGGPDSNLIERHAVETASQSR